MQNQVSVVIPGYNTPDSEWDRCVRSVLANGNINEVICVDDASPLRPAILKDLEKEFSNVKVIWLEENRGQAFARNAGLAQASSEFVAFVDSDDEVMPETYAKSLKALEKFNADIAVYGVETIWIKERLCKTDMPDGGYIGVLTPEKLLTLRRQALFNYPWNKVYRRRFLVQNNLSFRERCIPSEDEILNLECVMANATWVAVDYLGHKYYRQDGTSLARFRRYNSECDRTLDATWRRCKAFLKDDKRVLGRMGEMSELDFLVSEWMNMWRSCTPYSLHKRWIWLRTHKEIGGAFMFAKTFIFFLIRRHLYIGLLRRWNIKKHNANVINMAKGK